MHEARFKVYLTHKLSIHATTTSPAHALNVCMRGTEMYLTHKLRAYAATHRLAHAY